MKIIRCDEEMLEKIPAIVNLGKRLFESDVENFFAVYDEGEIGWLLKDGKRCLYLDKDLNEYYFLLNENDELVSYDKNGYAVMLDDVLTFYREDSVCNIGIDKIGKDNDGLDGEVIFVQYNENTDVSCVLKFRQKYDKEIYYYATKKIKHAFIDEKFREKGVVDYGVLPKRCLYFERVTYENGSLPFDIAAIKEFGIRKFIKNGAYRLVGSRYNSFYVPATYVKKNGNYATIWPFSYQLSEEEVRKLIKSYGFMDEVPEFFIDVYNGCDELGNKLSEMVSLMNELDKEYKLELK